MCLWKEFKTAAAEVRKQIIETHEELPNKEVPNQRRSARLSNRGLHWAPMLVNPIFLCKQCIKLSNSSILAILNMNLWVRWKILGILVLFWNRLPVRESLSKISSGRASRGAMSLHAWYTKIKGVLARFVSFFFSRLRVDYFFKFNWFCSSQITQPAIQAHLLDSRSTGNCKHILASSFSISVVLLLGEIGARKLTILSASADFINV